MRLRFSTSQLNDGAVSVGVSSGGDQWEAENMGMSALLQFIQTKLNGCLRSEQFRDMLEPTGDTLRSPSIVSQATPGYAPGYAPDHALPAGSQVTMPLNIPLLTCGDASDTSQ